ncbi:MAG TPA: hypothetical protein VF945_05130, partial [Polyangia bacterium]
SPLPFDILGGDCDGATLAGGASCTVKLARVVPSDAAVGTSAGTLEVAASPGGDLAAAPTLVVHATGVLSVSSNDFGNVPTLTLTSATMTVKNPGPVASGALTIHLASSETYPPFRIASDGCSGKSLAAGSACIVEVRVELGDVMEHTAMLIASALSLNSGSGLVSARGVRAHWALFMSAGGPGSGKLTYGGTPVTLSSGAGGFLIHNGQPSQAVVAVPDSGSTFTGWSGTAPCSGTGTCAPFIGADNSDVTLQATFSH